MKRFFIPRNTRFYSYVAHMHPAMRYGVTFAFCVFLVFVWLYGVYKPLERIIQKKQNRVLHVYTTIQHMHALQQYKDEVAALYADAYKGEQSNDLDCDARYQQHLITLLECVRATGATLVSYQAENPKQKGVYTRYNAHIVFRGSVDQTRDLFAQLEQAGLPVVCTRFACTAQRDNLYTITTDFCFLIVRAMQ